MVLNRHQSPLWKLPFGIMKGMWSGEYHVRNERTGTLDPHDVQNRA